MISVLFISFLAFLLLGVPVSLVMGGAAMVTVLSSESLRPILVPQHLFNGINSFPLMAVPLFILAADLMTAGKLTDSLLKFAKALVGHLPGGLGHVNILTSILFAGKSGSALADAAGPGALVLDMMRQAGYPKYYAGAMTAASAIIGPIIPPSIVIVVYAVSESRVSVSGMFAAGIVPGLLMGLALFATNHIVSVRQGAWDVGQSEPMQRSAQQTIGLVGYGKIARAFHRKIRALGVQRTLIHDPALSEPPAGGELADLPTLFATATVVSVHAPLSAATRHLISAELLGRMPPGAILINTARGGLIDEPALIERVLAGKLRVGLDVFEREPPAAAHPLFHSDDAVLSDHTGWYSEASVVELQHGAAAEVARVFSGQPPKSWLNPWEASA